MLEAGRAASQGVFRAAAAAAMTGRLPEPPSAPADAPAQRFEQRFAVFATLVRPEPLCYQQFTEAMDTSSAPSACFPCFDSRGYLPTRVESLLNHFFHHKHVPAVPDHRSGDSIGLVACT